MSLTRQSPGKVNLLLNILGRRSDGFHELETVLQPIPVADEITVEAAPNGVALTCDLPGLPADSRNLVHRAATAFFDQAAIEKGVTIELRKRLPLEAGLGGGSSNAATTLRLLNELYERPLDDGTLWELAAGLGSDVPFFLEDGPAIGIGRGERLERFQPFRALADAWIFLVHPGFGVSTPWAYQQLSSFPEALQGAPGRAHELVRQLESEDAAGACAGLYNALEPPVLLKYPLLALYQEFLRDRQALGTLMSGSGSTTFALWSDAASAQAAEKAFRVEFGDHLWTAVGPLGASAA